MYMYFPEIKGVLYGPEELSVPLLQRTILTPGFVPQNRVPAAKAPAKKAAKKAATKAKKAARKPGKKAG